MWRVLRVWLEIPQPGAASFRVCEALQSVPLVLLAFLPFEENDFVEGFWHLKEVV